MPTEISMNQRQRGTSLTLSFTIAYWDNDTNDREPKITDPIYVNDMAIVQFKFCHVVIGRYNLDITTLESSIKFKKTDKRKTDDSQIKIKLTTYDKTWEDKEWSCGNDWAEFQFNTKKRNIWTVDTTVTNLEVTITVQEVKSRCLQLTKLYDDTELTDFHLTAPDGNVAIHKAILAMHSDVFKMMFIREWKETLEGEIAIKGVNKQTLEDLKQYIYLGTLSDEGLEPLLVIAARYIMDELKTDCIAKMVHMVTPETVNDLVEFACLNNLPDLMRAILTETPDTVVNKLCKLSKGKIKDANN